MKRIQADDPISFLQLMNKADVGAGEVSGNGLDNGVTFLLQLSIVIYVNSLFSSRFNYYFYYRFSVSHMDIIIFL